MKNTALYVSIVAATTFVTSAAHAQVEYSLPWQLRSVLPANAVRVDSVVAVYDGGETFPTLVSGSYRLTQRLALLVRMGAIANSPDAGAGASAFVNPVVGASYGMPLGEQLRLCGFLGIALPLGMGGGDAPDPAEAAAEKSGVPARSAMDNALFAVDDLTFFPGVSLAWLQRHFTLQLEVTLLQLIRVRGDRVQKDSAKTNFTSGLHLGYFVAPFLSLGGELRYQRWLSTPAAVAADMTGTLRDTLSFAVGPRLHYRLGSGWIRPGIAYARGLTGTLDRQSYDIVQIDVPVSF